jgi:UDP-N-acetylglucosamine diphosphorylase / glucose-1-phosphate thymidylyltransferase / UDP-N-acetylgalactosamine diphosphorylase / glucosamine-1-phosphate N-acetyltransferase / galactosamine-1-phosphate N-acetyltransferase
MITWLHNSYNPQLFYPYVPFINLQLLKIGHYTIAERWQQVLKNLPNQDIHIAANCLPSDTIINYALQHKALPSNTAKHFIVLQSVVDVIKQNSAIFDADITLLLKRKKAKAHATIANVWVEKDVQIDTTFLNTTYGPIYISKNATIQEGVCLRGPIYIGENTVIKMGATIYGTTFIGSNCIVGGEVKNSIIMDNSNKAHFGYLGDSIIGEWCNLGAGTSNSNIKNNASTVTITLPTHKINAGNKMGCIMGNYSKTAIHTAINTGSVIGINCNVFCTGLTPKNIPHFSWGTEGEKYIFDKAVIEIEKWMAFKNATIKTDTIKKLKNIYNEKV